MRDTSIVATCWTRHFKSPMPIAPTNRPPVLFSISDATDPEYLTLATSDWQPVVVARAYIESVWPRVQPYLDDGFPSKAACAFRPHFWELYLCAALLDANMDLVPRSERGGEDAGPDFLLRDGTYVEAILATPGTGADAVTEAPLGEASYIPDAAIRLRILNAIDKKRRQLETYRASNLVAMDAPFVIAINTGAVPYARHENTLPRIVRSLLPFGDLQVHVDPRTFQQLGSSYQHESAVFKRKGSSVPTDGFLSADLFGGVSAVLYSCADPLNNFPNVGADFIVVHNPTPINRIPLEYLPATYEYSVQGEFVTRTPGIFARAT